MSLFMFASTLALAACIVMIGILAYRIAELRDQISDLNYSRKYMTDDINGMIAEIRELKRRLS